MHGGLLDIAGLNGNRQGFGFRGPMGALFKTAGEL